MREGGWLRGARARAACAAVAAYSCLLANGLSAAQERLLARGCVSGRISGCIAGHVVQNLPPCGADFAGHVVQNFGLSLSRLAKLTELPDALHLAGY